MTLVCHHNVYGRRIIACLLLTCLPLISIAELRSYWVLGSFRSADNAQREQARLTDELKTTVEIRYDTNHQVHRVIVSADQLSADEAGELKAWRVRLAVPADGPKAAPTPAPAAPPDRSTAAVIETPVESTPLPLYPAFEADESLADYCDRLATSPLCQHPGIQDLLVREKSLAAHHGSLANACQLISRPDWHNTCLELHPTRQ